MSRHNISMAPISADIFRVDAQFQPLIREVGLDARGVFDDPRIKVWRQLKDRENCTLDHVRDDGTRSRLHIKRFPPAHRSNAAAENEVEGYRLLEQARLPSAKVVAYGELRDGRSFVVTEDLAGYQPADKLIQQGMPFVALLAPLAAITAKLHGAGLHHRDLYLCHFMAKLQGATCEIRLIDAARVRRLSGWPMRTRWIVKDLAQFWYSALRLEIPEKERDQWLWLYARERAVEKQLPALRRLIVRKARAIARHDQRLNRAQPGRNVSLVH